MNFGHVYLSSDGVLNRKQWWVANIGLLIIAILFVIVIGGVFGVLGMDAQSLGVKFFALAVSLAVAFPVYNLSAKRLRDRARPLNLALIFILPGVVNSILQFLGLTGSYQPAMVFGQEAMVFVANGLGKGLGFLQLGIGLWALVELGILPSRRLAAAADSAPHAGF